MHWARNEMPELFREMNEKERQKAMLEFYAFLLEHESHNAPFHLVEFIFSRYLKAFKTAEWSEEQLVAWLCTVLFLPRRFPGSRVRFTRVKGLLERVEELNLKGLDTALLEGIIEATLNYDREPTFQRNDDGGCVLLYKFNSVKRIQNAINNSERFHPKPLHELLRKMVTAAGLNNP